MSPRAGHFHGSPACIFSARFSPWQQQGSKTLFLALKTIAGVFAKAIKNRKKCDVITPWWQNYWISTILFDRDGHLHCRSMEEKYGYSFFSWVQSCTGKSYMSIFSFFYPCLQDHDLLRSSSSHGSRNFVAMATWDNFSSLHLDRGFFLQGENNCKNTNRVVSGH